MIQLGQHERKALRQFLESDSPTAQATKILLAAVALGTVIVIAGVAPNLLQLLGQFNRRRRYGEKRWRNALYGLRRSRLVEIIAEKGDKSIVRLTRAGDQRIRELIIDELTIPQPQRWDGKWRVVIFDLPVNYRQAREAFRGKIKELGFYQLQKSVWVYPFPCRDEILFVAEFFSLTRYVDILTVTETLSEYKLARHFDL